MAIEKLPMLPVPVDLDWHAAPDLQDLLTFHSYATLSYVWAALALTDWLIAGRNALDLPTPARSNTDVPIPPNHSLRIHFLYIFSSTLVQFPLAFLSHMCRQYYILVELAKRGFDWLLAPNNILQHSKKHLVYAQAQSLLSTAHTSHRISLARRSSCGMGSLINTRQTNFILEG